MFCYLYTYCISTLLALAVSKYINDILFLVSVEIGHTWHLFAHYRRDNIVLMPAFAYRELCRDRSYCLISADCTSVPWDWVCNVNVIPTRTMQQYKLIHIWKSYGFSHSFTHFDYVQLGINYNIKNIFSCQNYWR